MANFKITTEMLLDYKKAEDASESFRQKVIADARATGKIADKELEKFSDNAVRHFQRVEQEAEEFRRAGGATGAFLGRIGENLESFEGLGEVIGAVGQAAQASVGLIDKETAELIDTTATAAESFGMMGAMLGPIGALAGAAIGAVVGYFAATSKQAQEAAKKLAEIEKRARDTTNEFRGLERIDLSSLATRLKQITDELVKTKGSTAGIRAEISDLSSKGLDALTLAYEEIGLSAEAASLAASRAVFGDKRSVDDLKKAYEDAKKAAEDLTTKNKEAGEVASLTATLLAMEIIEAQKTYDFFEKQSKVDFTSEDKLPGFEKRLNEANTALSDYLKNQAVLIAEDAKIQGEANALLILSAQELAAKKASLEKGTTQAQKKGLKDREKAEKESIKERNKLAEEDYLAKQRNERAKLDFFIELENERDRKTAEIIDLGIARRIKKEENLQDTFADLYRREIRLRENQAAQEEAAQAEKIKQLNALASEYKAILSPFADVLGSITGHILENLELGKSAFDGLAKAAARAISQTLKALGKEYAVKALGETAYGLASLALGPIGGVSAADHFAAAATFGLAALAAGVGGAIAGKAGREDAGAGGGRGASSGFSGGPGASQRTAFETNVQAPIIVQFNSVIPPTERDAAQAGATVSRLIEAHRNSGGTSFAA